MLPSTLPSTEVPRRDTVCRDDRGFCRTRDSDSESLRTREGGGGGAGNPPTAPDRICQMERKIRESDPTSAWRRLPPSKFVGAKIQRDAAALKYVRDEYNTLRRKDQLMYIDSLSLDTRVDMVVYALLTWYHNPVPERKAIGLHGQEVP